jgi:hypothetical protein
MIAVSESAAHGPNGVITAGIVAVTVISPPIGKFGLHPGIPISTFTRPFTSVVSFVDEIVPT